MKSTVPKAEAEADLAATLRDVTRLSAIVDNLRLFIHDSAGENRSLYRMDLMRFEKLLDDGRNLETAIRQHVASL